VGGLQPDAGRHAPTWTLSFDAKLDIFKDMRFDPSNPGANTAVGLGYHQFVWSTFVSKRFPPLRSVLRRLVHAARPHERQHLRRDSRTESDGGQPAAARRRHGGLRAGRLGEPARVAARDRRVPRARRGALLRRSATELWEPLSGSSSCSATNATACRAGIDFKRRRHGGSPAPRRHRDAGVRELRRRRRPQRSGRQVREVPRLFGLLLNQPHFLTYAGTGIDRGGTKGVDLNDANEANQTYRDALDAPGRRFKVESTQIWSLFLEGSVMF
jgi:hypothetical protein